MRSLNVAIVAIILSIVVHAKCVGESEEGFERKRFDLTLASCMENFDVHTDMIIRTQDSRAMGAKYLNEAEVAGRDECQKLCCETDSCDVYIYEQKVPGSCYLFHCGPPDDFKCKFTQHRNYTSAILTVNNHLNELENQIKLTKHEEELNNLRKTDLLPGTTTPPVATSTKVPDQVDPKINHSSRSHCSRYQFECRGSGECIAIYNACDGIPQCSDGSDEAPELDCPTLSGTTRPRTSDPGSKKTPETTPRKLAATQDIHQPAKPAQSYKPPTGWQGPSSGGYVPGYGMTQPNGEYPSGPQKVDSHGQFAYQTRIYGREGEVLGQQYPLTGMQWQGYPMQRQDEGSHIFNHKGSGLVPDGSDRYSDGQDGTARIHHGQIPGPYGSELSHSDYLKYAAATGNGYYNGPVYYPNNMPPRQQQQQPQNVPGAEDIPQRPGLSMYGNGLSAPGPSDYYYEDPQLRARVPLLQDPRISKNLDNGLAQQNPMQAKLDEKQPPFRAPSPIGGFESDKPKMTESVKKTLEKVHFSTTSSTSRNTEKVPSTTASGRTERPVHGVAAELTMSETEADGASDRPSGAILSLTLGMCITAIMIALVGCRLRVVRRRMRRSGKLPYAHDPDFLVNGMYL